MVIDEEAKAVREVAKTTGKAVDGIRDFGVFIADHTRGSLEQAMGMIEDKFTYMRWERQQRLMLRAKEYQNELGLDGPTKPLSMKIAIPLLQGASLEEDDELQDRWAKLLVNATDERNDFEIPRIYITVLEHINSFEAQLLDKIYSLPKEEAKEGIWTKNLPDEIILNHQEGEDMSLTPLLELALANLSQLSLITGAMFWGGGVGLVCVYQTVLGRNFLNACKLPTEKSANEAE